MHWDLKLLIFGVMLASQPIPSRQPSRSIGKNLISFSNRSRSSGSIVVLQTPTSSPVHSHCSHLVSRRLLASSIRLCTRFAVAASLLHPTPRIVVSWCDSSLDAHSSRLRGMTIPPETPEPTTTHGGSKRSHNYSGVSAHMWRASSTLFRRSEQRRGVFWLLGISDDVINLSSICRSGIAVRYPCCTAPNFRNRYRGGATRK